ncbi:hypothetical protein BDN72DRAFT_782668, partial [Pluteus cervinus]
RLVGQLLLYAVSTFASPGVFLFGYKQGNKVMSGIITGPHNCISSSTSRTRLHSKLGVSFPY